MMETVTKKAIANIGEQTEDDWVLAPEKHAQALPAEAESLRDRLQNSEVTMRTKRYRRHDKAAIAAQNKFQSYSKYRIFSAAFAAISGGLYLYLGKQEDFNAWLGAGHDAFYFVIILVNIVFFAAAAFYTFQLKKGSSYDDWQEQRAEAENARLEYFQVVTAAPQAPYEAEGDSPEFMALQLEYFRRYMLDMQYHYYEGRSKQHRQKAQRLVFYGAALTALVAAGGALSNYDNVGVQNSLSNVAALLSVIVPSLLTMEAQFSSLNEDRKSIRRYEYTFKTLEYAKAELDRVRYDVAHGKRQALTDFVEQVNTALATEHQAWLKREKAKI